MVVELPVAAISTVLTCNDDVDTVGDSDNALPPIAACISVELRRVIVEDWVSEIEDVEEWGERGESEVFISALP